MAPLQPEARLLTKIGSILAHVEEGFSPGGRDVDFVTVKTLLADPEVQAWMEEMRGLALLPVKR